MVYLQFGTKAILSFLLVMLALANPTPNIGASSVLDLIPKDYIDQVRAYDRAVREAEAHNRWRMEKRALSMLEKRVPVDNHCPEGTTWAFRMCNANVNERAYDDTCRNNENGQLIDVPGTCPDNTVCELTGNIENDQFVFDIICVPKTPPSQDVITRRDPKGRRRLAQYGRRFKRRGVRGEQVENIPVYIDHRGAFISAQFLCK